MRSPVKDKEISAPYGSQRFVRQQLIAKAERLFAAGRVHDAERAWSEADGLLLVCVDEAEQELRAEVRRHKTKTYQAKVRSKSL